jgi:hypothetical protein
MFSKEESRLLRKEFWITFGKSFPRKWLLYDTKIKDFSFKFYADRKKVMVLLDIEMPDDELRYMYFEKVEALHNIIRNDFLKEVLFERDFVLEDSGKIVSRMYVVHEGVSIHNKNTWQEMFYFLKDNMHQMELFFYEYEDYLK